VKGWGWEGGVGENGWEGGVGENGWEGVCVRILVEWGFERVFSDCCGERLNISNPSFSLDSLEPLTFSKISLPR